LHLSRIVSHPCVCTAGRPGMWKQHVTNQLGIHSVGTREEAKAPADEGEEVEAVAA